jgi:uncharacterized protein
MARKIDSRFGVDYLKKDAKQWLKLLRAGNAAAAARFNQAVPKQRVARGGIALRTVQHALARERGFDNWLALVASVDSYQRALREAADEILRHAIFKGDHLLAARLYRRHRGIATLDIYSAVAAGDAGKVGRQLAADPTAATRAGGPLQWPPILYLAYIRCRGPVGGDCTHVAGLQCRRRPQLERRLVESLYCADRRYRAGRRR